MFIVDDLLVRPFVSLIGILQAMAINELFDRSELHDQLKENQLLYELGERSKDEYETHKAEIEAELELAEEVQSRLSGRVEVKG